MKCVAKKMASQREEPISDLPQVEQVLNEGLHEGHLAQYQVQKLGNVRIDRRPCQHLQNLRREKDRRAYRCAHLVRDS